MKMFEYAKVDSPEAAVGAIGEGAKFIAGGTNLLDLMKLQIETPDKLVDISRLDLTGIEDARGWRADDRGAGAEQRPRRGQACHPGLSGAQPRAARRRFGPAPQQGDDRRQPAPADPLLLFLRHRDALQQARPRQRLFGDRRLQPHPRDTRHERAVHRDASERHGGGDARARCDDRHAEGRTAIGAASRSPISIACRATRRISRRRSSRAS